MDLRPLRTSRDFRLLIASRTVSLLGAEVALVALMVQVKQLTNSQLAVGLLGAAELVPIVACGLYGGVLADRLDRKKIAVWSEAGLALILSLLALNAALPRPLLWPVYAGNAGIVALGALQQPSLDAVVPRIVPRDQLTAGSALSSVTANVSFIAGPAVGGLLVTGPGAAFAYSLDVAALFASFVLLLRMRAMPAVQGAGLPEAKGLRALMSGLHYARRRQHLVGSYLVDLSAMIFAFPTALFPFVAADLHAEWALGLMYAAPAVGALAASATSAWAGRVRRHGAAIAISAVVWGAGITGFGLAPGVGAALAFLAVAGVGDMMSGIFRDTLWNQTIPDAMRGRMAGVELLSYAVGPSAGQVRSGFVARFTSTRFSLWSGGIGCIAAVGLICLAFPRFTRYDCERDRGLAPGEDPAGEAPGQMGRHSTAK
jgi:MFS family permease